MENAMGQPKSSARGSSTGESDRFCASCGAPLERISGHREMRKKVSILFLDIVGFTTFGERLDPEPLRQIMDRYYAACGTAIKVHGGAVEKFIGDAILAAFGAVVAHEDDAVRAVRAAVEALDQLRDLSAELMTGYQVALEARCGVCTGDVIVTIAPDGDFRVIGDAVNTASRLQNAAQPGEILIDANTAAVVSSKVGIEPVAALKLKGKARAVAAWRVTEPVIAGRSAPLSPFIGRDDDLAELLQAYRRTQRPQVCMVTVLGAPGIGKSRLVQEFLATLGEGEATVLSGWCSAYGRGITYKPLAEMLGSFSGGWAALAPMLDEDLAARGLGAVMGEPGSVGTGDIAWAVRHLLEVLGRQRPVVMVWEDLHWAEETLLDLIDDIAAWLHGVPVLLICLARSELLESRSAWGSGKPCALTLDLGPLSYEQSAGLVSELVMRGDVYPQEQHEEYKQIAARCDGNPLFVELMMDVFADTARSGQIPPTIEALLGARLDQLSGPERSLLELAAIAGRECPGDLLSAMAAEAGISADPMAGLVRRRIMKRGASGTFRFTQTLLRDTAYAFTPKSRREHWHAFLASWLAASGQDALAVAYHVEAAYQLRKQLRPGDPGLPELAATAAGALVAEGTRALGRKDLPAAIALLERGRDLLPPGDGGHTALALHICDAGLGLWEEDRPLAALAAAEAALPGDRHNTAACAIERCIIALRLGLAPPTAVAADAELITVDADDHLGWCRLHQLRAYLHLIGENAVLADESLRLALARARARADVYEEERLLCAICELAQWTPVHVRDGLVLCAALRDRFAANRDLLVPVLVTQARLTALTGALDDARATLATAHACTGDLHRGLAEAAVMETSGFVESLAGAHREAEEHYRRSLAVLQAAQRAPDTQNIEVDIARELFNQGQSRAAALALDRVEAGDAIVSPRARIAIAALRGRIASAHGDHDAAVLAAEEATELSGGTDDLCLSGETRFDLAIVLAAAGLTARAAAEAAVAQRKFDAKGAVLLTARVREWK